MGWGYIGQHRLEIEVDIHTIAYTGLMSDVASKNKYKPCDGGPFPK
jgi:hypothetical protein